MSAVRKVAAMALERAVDADRAGEDGGQPDIQRGAAGIGHLAFDIQLGGDGAAWS